MKVDYVRKVGLKTLGELGDDTRLTLLWRSGLMDKNKEEMTEKMTNVVVF